MEAGADQDEINRLTEEASRPTRKASCLPRRGASQGRPGALAHSWNAGRSKRQLLPAERNCLRRLRTGRGFA